MIKHLTTKSVEMHYFFLGGGGLLQENLSLLFAWKSVPGPFMVKVYSLLYNSIQYKDHSNNRYEAIQLYISPKE